MPRNFIHLRAFFIAFATVFCVAIALIFTSGPQQAQNRKAVKRDITRPAGQFSDTVTSEIRKASNDLFHVPVTSAADREKASRLGTIISDHNSFVIAVANESVAADQFGEAAFKIDTTIHLPGGSFDPLNDPPLETVRPGVAPKFGPGYFVVQLGGIATDEILNSIRSTGFEVIQYVPHNAFIVYGEASSASRVAENSRIRWVGELTARNKIPPSLLTETTGTKSPRLMYNIAVFSRADLNEAARRITEVSGGRLLAEVPVQHTYFNIVRVMMSPGQLEAVASIPDVVRIDSWQYPTKEDERAAQIVAGNYTSTTSIAAAGYNPLSQFGVDGTNVTVAVADDGVSIPGNGGFYLTATNTLDVANLRGCTAGAEGGHGHLNASIIAGASPFGGLDPLGYNYGLGIAPKSHILNIPMIKGCGSNNCCYTGTDANAANDAVATNGPNGVPATISNNSWGAGTNGNAYDSLAALYDGLARDASTAGSVDPLLFVFSAGNSGVSGLTRPKMAKNVIAVGNSENLRTELSASANNIDDMAGSSSRGPAADGRIKPDITAPGTVITGSRAGTDCSGVSNCFEANHSWSTGTSHAAPQVAGVAALFTQFWKGQTGGLNPSPAMTKAAILLSGQEMNGNGSGTALPNGDEGWGRVNMRYVLNTGVAMRLVDQNSVLSNPGSETVYTGKIADPDKPFRAALVWTDPPGTVDPALVNNLDLTVKIGDNIYRGNNLSGGLSVQGGTADTKNNVEQVRTGNIAANTPVTVTVTATGLNGDGVIGNGDSTDQNYALVLYNFEEAPQTEFRISGRITEADGRGVANVFVVLESGGSVVRTTYSNSFGYYSFSNVPGSTQYLIKGIARRFSVTEQQVALGTADLTSINLTATRNSP